MSHAPASTAEIPPSLGGRVSKEFDLLCSCASVDLSPERVARIATSIEGGIDWTEFLRLAEHHGVLPLAARNLSSTRAVPPEVTQSLCQSFATNVRRNLWFASELARIAEHFERKNLRAVPYKGPTLAQAAYGDIALRNFGDLDFLIAPSDFGSLKSALSELGYYPSKDLTPAVERFWLRKGYECSFDSAAGKFLVELQWRLLPYFYAVDLRTEELLQRSVRTKLGGIEIPSLSPEDTLLVLCLHAAKHLWMRLIWVCDIAETMRTQSIDYSIVLSRARTLGITRFVLVSFWLARRLLGAAIPEELERELDDPALPTLGEELASRLARAATYDFESTEYFRWILRLRERRSDRWRYLWRLVWTPGVGDIASVRLPEALFPLYRGVRLARLIRKWV